MGGTLMNEWKRNDMIIGLLILYSTYILCSGVNESDRRTSLS